MKVVGLSGSPRRDGNTEMLLNELLKGAASQGAEVKTFRLATMKIKPCQHCDYCLEAGCCKIQDDMQVIYGELAAADVIVLASPIQFMGVTADAKAMIDRCQAMWARKYILKVPPIEPKKERRGFFISVGGRKVSNLFDGALLVIKTFFRIIDVTYTGDMLFTAIDEKGAIANHPDALKQAFAVGQKLAVAPATATSE